MKKIDRDSSFLIVAVFGIILIAVVIYSVFSNGLAPSGVTPTGYGYWVNGNSSNITVVYIEGSSAYHKFQPLTVNNGLRAGDKVRIDYRHDDYILQAMYVNGQAIENGAIYTVVDNFTISYTERAKSDIFKFSKIEGGVYRKYIAGLADNVSETNIVIPSSYENVSIKEIGPAAFKGRTFESLTIPASITKIDNDAFKDCIINTLYISDLAAWCNITFENRDACPQQHATNIIYNNEAITELKFSQILDNDNFTKIKDYTFMNFRDLRTVTFTDKITECGQSAFEGCIALKNITFPDSLTLINSKAFYGCTAITELTFHENMILKDKSFGHTTHLTTCNFNVTGFPELQDGYIFDEKTGTEGAGITLNFGENVNHAPKTLFSTYDYVTNVKAYLSQVNNTKVSFHADFKTTFLNNSNYTFTRINEEDETYYYLTKEISA